jgi:hypothetical protein
MPATHQQHSSFGYSELNPLQAEKCRRVVPDAAVTRKAADGQEQALMNASRAWSRANRSANSIENLRLQTLCKFTESNAGPGIAPGTFPPANLARGYTGLVNQEAVEGKRSTGQHTVNNPRRERDTVRGAGNSDRLSSNGKAASSINSGKCSKSATSGMPHGSWLTIRNVGYSTCETWPTGQHASINLMPRLRGIPLFVSR